MPRIEFIGIRGGHGTTTVALAAAVTLATRAPTRVAAHDPATLLALAGVAGEGLPVALDARLELSSDPAAGDVFDSGSLDHQSGTAGPVEGLRVGVLRGPDYLGLRTLCDHTGVSLDGLVVVAEPGRALDARDVEAVAGIPVVAVVDHSPAVARVIDAGLFMHLGADRREFARLRSWIDQFVVAERRSSVAS